MFIRHIPELLNLLIVMLADVTKIFGIIQYVDVSNEHGTPSAAIRHLSRPVSVSVPPSSLSARLPRVRSLLQERLRLLRRAAWPLDGEVGDQPLSASLPWTDIVQVRSGRVTSAVSSVVITAGVLSDFCGLEGGCHEL